MMKTTKKNLKELVKFGMAIELTSEEYHKNAKGTLNQIAYARGMYGFIGGLYHCPSDGKLYVYLER